MSDTQTVTPAEHAAACISTYVVALGLRLIHGPLGEVPQDELDTYAAMRDALAALSRSAPPLTGTPNNATESD